MPDIQGKLSILLDIYQNDGNLFNTAFKNKLQKNIYNYKKLYTSDENPLTNYSIKQLEMRGFISSNLSERKFGLIQILNKNIYKVELGDTIGQENFNIIRIDREKILLSKNDKEITMMIAKKNRND